MAMNMNTPMRGSASTALALIMTLGLTAGPSVASDDQHHEHHDQVGIPDDAAVPLFEGLGDHHFPITTASDAAQAYFNQGLMFVFGFNHFEAVRSFEEGTRHDGDCAMCYWGMALAFGPHINAPMMPDAVAPAHEAILRAQALAAESSEREQAYIEALSHRYLPEAPEDRSGLDRDYADAMRTLVERHGDDLDARTLFAESLMNLVAWDYWAGDGQPREETAELIDELETVLEHNPYHPGANHFYVHAIENSPEPGRAEEAADRLAELNIQIGHMIHMPAHIYAQVGRWSDASMANEKAIEADRAYLDAYDVEGFVPLLYHPHNVHFLAWTSGMEGRRDLARRAAGDLAEATPEELPRDLPFMKNFLLARVLTHLRFEEWDEVLALPEPDAEAAFLRGMWHYARGTAFAGQEKPDEASAEADRLAAIFAGDEAADLKMPEAFLPGQTMLQVADSTLQGEIKLQEGDAEGALESLRTAVELQNGLPYFEPPYWFVSARLNLARALLQLGRPDEAEEVYRADLDIYPRNGWALRGLMLSLEAQGDDEGAREAEAQFDKEWADADVAFAVDDVGLVREDAR